MKIDKILHFAVNLIVMLTLDFNIFLAISACVFLSIGKETYDQYKYQGWSNGDLIADLVGLITGLIIVLVKAWIW